jgi:hypothetical protein
MHQVSTAAQAILTASARASISPADLLRITATAIAERHCSCVDLSAGICLACREAQHLHSLADKVVDLAEAVDHIVDACMNDLVDLLPGIVESMLDQAPAACSCTDDATCPICAAARYLDETARFLQAA